MTWTRLDDGWSDQPVFEGLSFEVRWHYLCLVQFCSRTSRYDGVVRTSDSRRCSDVPDPSAAVSALLESGLLVEVDGGLKVVRIDEHVPPPHLRDEARKAAQSERKRRERQHKRGVHHYCLPEHCEAVRPDVTRDFTRDVGTGQDGTGRDNGTNTREGQREPWDDVVVAVPGEPRSAYRSAPAMAPWGGVAVP